MFALEIENVCKTYGHFKALNNINFNIEQGDFVGLLGVNGAGKTTLISSIAGINRFEGSIRVMGHDVLTDVVAAKRKVGIVPQELAYDPFLTVYQALKFQSGLYGVNDKEWLFEVIERMHLGDKVNSGTRGLSGGMKRRLMVAQALVHKPPLIILDEPTAGVDVEIRKSLWEFITQLHQKGHTILLTTHYLEEVEVLCNKIIMIDKGDILAESLTTDLMKQSGNLPTTAQIEVMGCGELSSELKALLVETIPSKSNHNSDVIGAPKLSTFTFRLQNSDELLPILNGLKLANMKVEDIQINHPSLEDIFINCIHK